MDFINHPSNDALYGAPKDWDQTSVPCSALPATRTVVNGVPAIKSYWKPTELELENLLLGAPVCLTVLSMGMPPVCLSVEI